MSSNLPPGVTEGMIPGNRPEDVEWDHLWDWVSTVDISPWELQNLIVNWATANHRDFEVPPPIEREYR